MFRAAETNYPVYNEDGKEILIHFAKGYEKGIKKDVLGYMTYNISIVSYDGLIPAVIRVKEGCPEVMIFQKDNASNMKLLLKEDGKFVAIDDDEYEEPDEGTECGADDDEDYVEEDEDKDEDIKRNLLEQQQKFQNKIAEQFDALNMKPSLKEEHDEAYEYIKKHLLEQQQKFQKKIAEDFDANFTIRPIFH